MDQGTQGAAGAAATDACVVALEEVTAADVALVGGKAARLGELTRIAGVRVPPGFCVTAAALGRATAQAPELEELVERLAGLDPGDAAAVGSTSAEVRSAVARLEIPGGVAGAITAAVARAGDGVAWAVRSSATAEDLPTASFAGQHDSYLGIVGAAAVLDHVRRVWASLFSDAAVVYRLQRGIDHRSVRMAVVVQRMVSATAAGVGFTADPVTSNRHVAAVEAVPALGDALVSGRVRPDLLRIRHGEVVDRAPAAREPVLHDEEALELVRLARRIEAHFGTPQDIEWCLAGGELAVVQSRPITTLFPIPEADEAQPHVYLSVGHQQMMTDAMRPLGLSLFQATAMAPMHEAGGRLFVDVAPALAAPARREPLLRMIERSEPLTGDALRGLVGRGGWPPDEPAGPGAPPEPIDADPALVEELVARDRASLAALQERLAELSGSALVDAVVADVQELKRLLLDPRSHQAFTSAMEASWWLKEHLAAWLGEEEAADVLSQSVPGNVTSEMGLALLDVADAIRPHPEVVAFLEQADDEDVLERLPELPGGQRARDALEAYLADYGMRCAGEIDITRPRWSERPTSLLPTLLGNVRHFEPGAGRRVFAAGQERAAAAERDVLSRLRALPDGARKAEETQRAIARLRTFSGYREHPKHHIVSRYFAYKQALLAEAQRLVAAGVLGAPEDVFWLTLPELSEVVRAQQADRGLLLERERAFSVHQALTPPRVLTSEGEVVTGSYHRGEVPPGTLVGLPVSAGIVEGRARVVLDLADAALEPGDVLVTVHTDPGWSPLFLAAAGLVTEVGGQMTHGAVIAREYGLPAVVGVDGAARSIRDGQRVRVDGTRGLVELLE